MVAVIGCAWSFIKAGYVGNAPVAFLLRLGNNGADNPATVDGAGDCAAVEGADILLPVGHLDQDSGFDQFNIDFYSLFQHFVVGNKDIVVFVKHPGACTLEADHDVVRAFRNGREEGIACFLQYVFADFDKA